MNAIVAPSDTSYEGQSRDSNSNTDHLFAYPIKNFIFTSKLISSSSAGDYEPNDDECDFPSDDEEELAEEVKEKVNIEQEKAAGEAPASGVPEFWLTIFKNVENS